MRATVEAVFRDGVFTPVSRPDEVAEGARVRLTIESLAAGAPDEILSLARRVYDGLSPEDLADVEQMARRRTLFADEAPPR